MSALPAGSVDMVFADPPYNLQLAGELHRPNNSRVDGVEDDWDKFDDFAAYDPFTRGWLAAARRVLKDDGTLWVIGSYHNIFRVGAALQDLGFWILNDVIWRKTNPMPNFRGKRFTNAHETLIWCAKGPGARYTFNYEAMKALNDDLQMRSRLAAAALRRRRAREARRPEGAPDAEARSAAATASILAATEPGELVLDPFFGSGTTGAVARKLGRDWIGIEREDSYAEVAERRASAAPSRPPTPALLATPAKRDEPRIPFGAGGRARPAAPGDTLFDVQRRFAAARPGRRHRWPAARRAARSTSVGAEVQGAPACNGWTFWHFDVEGKAVPIDVLRQRIRAELVPPTTDTPAESPGELAASP